MAEVITADEHKRIVAVMVLGLAVGMMLGLAVAHSYAGIVLQDRAEDGRMVQAGGRLYTISAVNDSNTWGTGNLTEFKEYGALMERHK
jgi:multidrug resistance efflux pump